jgi:hypothetical protein
MDKINGLITTALKNIANVRSEMSLDWRSSITNAKRV